METATTSPVSTKHKDQDAIMSSPPPPSPPRKATSSQHHLVDHSAATDTTKKQLFQIKRRRGSQSQTIPKRRKNEFDLLDPTNDVHAKRIASREKALQKGKNTAGYDAYVRTIPKEHRQLRSMETPSTPNPHWDIPAKRWQGIVKAWRRALHKYDPPDMMRDDSMLDASASPIVAETSLEEESTPVSAATHPSDEVSPMSTGRTLDFGVGEDDSDDDLL